MLMKLNKSNKKLSGFGLLELMLSMVIAAVLIVMATRYYTQARENVRVNTGVQVVQGILAAQESYFNSEGAYTATISDLDPYLPPSSYSNPWPAGPVTTAGTADNTIVVVFPMPSSQSCTYLKRTLDRTVSDVTCGTDNTLTATFDDFSGDDNS